MCLVLFIMLILPIMQFLTRSSEELTLTCVLSSSLISLSQITREHSFLQTLTNMSCLENLSGVVRERPW